MIEQTFIDLGFTRNDIPIEESGADHDFYYYTLDIGDICLMSNSDDKAEEEGWNVTIFDSDTCVIKGVGDLEDLVRIISNNTI
jgi:hypothetical protein